MEMVMVVADGFAWNGEIFASLSAVAQAITGTKWNGHRFFGVRPQDRSCWNIKKRMGVGTIHPLSGSERPCRPQRLSKRHVNCVA